MRKRQGRGWRAEPRFETGVVCCWRADCCWARQNTKVRVSERDFSLLHSARDKRPQRRDGGGLVGWWGLPAETPSKAGISAALRFLHGNSSWLLLGADAWSLGPEGMVCALRVLSILGFTSNIESISSHSQQLVRTCSSDISVIRSHFLPVTRRPPSGLRNPVPCRWYQRLQRPGTGNCPLWCTWDSVSGNTSHASCEPRA